MDDDELIEAMAKAMSESGNKDWMYAEDWFKDIYIGQAIAALAVARPIIEAETYEKCAHLCFMLSDVPPETEADKEASRALTSAGNLMKAAAMSVREESRD